MFTFFVLNVFSIVTSLNSLIFRRFFTFVASGVGAFLGFFIFIFILVFAFAPRSFCIAFITLLTIVKVRCAKQTREREQKQSGGQDDVEEDKYGTSSYSIQDIKSSDYDER